MTHRSQEKLNAETQRWLKIASRWRLLSLLFQLPTPSSRHEMKRLAQTAPKNLRELVEKWLETPLHDMAAEFHRVLGPGGVPAVESSYDPNALAGRGPLLADIAGFHEAFAYRPENPPAAVPDHIAAQLDFLSFLSIKIAFALQENRRDAANISQHAYETFQRDHLHTWINAFREKLHGTESLFFIRAAELIGEPQAPSSTPRSRRALQVLALILLFLVGPVFVRAQTKFSADKTATQETSAAAKPAQQSTAPKPIKIGDVVFSGSLRARMENWRWFETPAAEDSYTFGGFNLRLALEQKRERIEWRLEGLFPLLAGLPTNAVRPAPQGQLGLGAAYCAANGRRDGSAVFRQGFLRFKHVFGSAASSIRLGRLEFGDGAEVAPSDATLAALKRERIAHRLIGNFGFSHVGRGFDGMEYVFGTKANNLTLFAARPTEGVFQLRSLKQLDVDVFYGAYTHQFSGKASKGEARGFLLFYHDGRGALKTDNRPLAARTADLRNIRLTSIGGHWIGVFGAGAHKTDVLLWGAAQFGRWGNLDHRAGAWAIELGHQFPGGWKPWLRGGYFISSGDGDPGDGKHSTFFQALPTPRIYARFPFYNLMNNQDLFLEFRLKPAAKFLLRADVRHVRLSNRGDLWYLGGGAFQEQTFGFVGRPSNQHNALGTLFDVSLDFDLTSMTKLTFYAGGVRGGDVQAAIYPAGGANPGARFLYLELFQRF